MTTTLLDLRTKLNGEIGVDEDAVILPWPATVRNNAISDGYSALWIHGVWKPLTQDIASNIDTWTYALTDIRSVYRVEVLDSSDRIIDLVKARAEDDGQGSWMLLLPQSLLTGYTMRVRGYGPYKSVFTDDADEDDLPAEYNRIPLLKAKSILYRAQMGRFAQYGERNVINPAMNVSLDQLLGLISAAEREFQDECKALAGRRIRSMQGSRAVVT